MEVIPDRAKLSLRKIEISPKRTQSMKIRIQTTQNVDLEYEIAGIGYRFLAALIDLLIIFGYLLGVVTVLSMLDTEPSWGLGSILSLPILLYPVVCEILMDGQTFGKKAMKLKVVKIDGSQPTTGDYLLRWLLWIVEANPLFGALGLVSISIVSIIVTHYGQRLGDLAAGTTVVRMTPQEEMNEAVLRPVTIDYQPRWPQVNMLNDHDVAVIKKGFEAVAKGAEPEILNRIAYKVAAVLHIEAARIGPTEIFLRTIINDYNAVTGRVIG